MLCFINVSSFTIQNIFVSMIMATLNILWENCCFMWMYFMILFIYDFQIKIIWIYVKVITISFFFYTIFKCLWIVTSSFQLVIQYNKESFDPLVLFGYVWLKIVLFIYLLFFTLSDWHLVSFVALAMWIHAQLWTWFEKVKWS